MSARVSNAGGPFLLEGLGVLGHTTFIGHQKYLTEFIFALFKFLKIHLSSKPHILHKESSCERISRLE